MAASCGADLGNACIVAVRPFGLITGAPTEAMPGAPASVALVFASTALAAAGSAGSWATTVSGPLKPLPKPCASRS